MHRFPGITMEDYARGYIICTCGKFAHILRTEVLQKLPKDYHGELCPECGLFMCAVDKLLGKKDGAS
jgi:hypothetical protein